MENKNNEIDLIDVSKSIKDTFSFTKKRIKGFVTFIKKNIIMLLILFVLGAAGGFLIDKYKKKYISTIIVSPNFETVDYLYEKIKLLDAKIGQEDQVSFRKEYGIPENLLTEVQITAVPDIYTLARRKESNYNVFKTLTENANASKVMEDYATSKHYSKHLITINSKGKIDKKTAEGIVTFLNTSDFYSHLRKEILNNVKDQIKVNDSVVKQIDAILNNIPNENTTSSTIYLSETQNLNQLVQEKLDLVEESHQLKVHTYELEYIITPINYSLNLNDKKGLNGKYKYVLPILFVFLFLIFSSVRKFK